MKNNYPISFLILPFVFYACSGKENKETTSKADTIKVDTSIVVQAKDTSAQEISLEEYYQKKGSQIMKEEEINYLHLGDNIYYAIKVLGEPTSESEPIVWESDGWKHKKLTYANGVILDMVEDDSVDFVINSITIESPSKMITSKDIKIGSSLQEVLTAYKESIHTPLNNPSVVTAGSIYGGLFFEMENGKVSRIFLGPGAE